MNKHDRVMEIFLNECKEILEEIAPKLLNLEETPNDKDLINDIFRGVHTLKGNANSFGFVKLGEFVHHFEDLLSIYRKEDTFLEHKEVDLFIRSFDIVETVFSHEEEGLQEYPQNYHVILDEIKKALDFKEKKQEEYEEIVSSSSFAHAIKENEIVVKMLQHVPLDLTATDGKKLYEIKMDLDSDIYLRGYNHQIFFRLLSGLGEILYSYYIIDANIAALENFDVENSYIKTLYIYLLSEKDEMDIEDVFEFIAQEHEISLGVVEPQMLQKLKNTQKEISQESKEAENESALKSGDRAKSSIRVESVKLDELFDSIGELVIAQSYISQNEQIRTINNNELNQYLEMLGKSTKIIQNKVMSLRMIPIKDTFLKMKRVVRDVSIKTHKEIELLLSGEDTEIDKTMVDKLSEPLIHLLRNSVDHGIEAHSDERIMAGKNPFGTIHLSASHKGSSFVIEIKDDGRGIDTQKILQKAIEKGFAKEGVSYTQEEIINFLFYAGFSTANEITDISGRGVGLDAVKRSIEEMRGKVNVESELGVGTTFRIVLPLTLAIIDGLNIRVHNEMFIVPTLSVVESFSPVIEDVHHVKGKGEFINYRGEILPIVRLNRLLNLSQDKTALEESTFICIDHERGRYILQVNELLGRQQVVIKSLGVLSSNVKEISGAAILGTGNIALILNTEGIRDHLDLEQNV